MGFEHRIDETYLQPKRSTKYRFRASIFEAWDHQCAYCDCPADTLDHVVPRSAGGLTVATNLIPACRSCNGRTGSSPWLEWLEQQRHHCPDRVARIVGWLAG